MLGVVSFVFGSALKTLIQRQAKLRRVEQFSSDVLLESDQPLVAKKAKFTHP